MKLLEQRTHELAAAGATVLLQRTAAEPPRRTESQKSCLCTPGVPAQYVHSGASRAHTHTTQLEVKGRTQ